MFKKSLLITSFLVFSSVMIIGAIYRSEMRINLVVSSTNENHNENTDTSESLRWQTLHGVVTQIDAATLTITIQNSQIVLVEGQPLAFAVNQGFDASRGDTITVEGYEKNGEFKVGRIINLTTGQQIQLRDIEGQLAWRGQSKRY